MRRDDLLTAGLVLLGCAAVAILIPGDLIAKGLNFLGLSTVWFVVGLLFVIFRVLRRGLLARWRRRAERKRVLAERTQASAPDYDEIAEIGLDGESSLYVRTRSNEYPHIYRMASGVRWDADRRRITIRVDSRLPRVDWFRLIWQGAAQEYGVRLQLGGVTEWTNVELADRQAIVALIPQLHAEDDARREEQDKNRAAGAIQMAARSIANSVRPRAEAAFRSGRYEAAAELYSLIREVLTPSELKKLDLALRRSTAKSNDGA